MIIVVLLEVELRQLSWLVHSVQTGGAVCAGSMHWPSGRLGNKETAPPHKVKRFSVAAPSMAGHVQIMSIDQSSSHTECRADSKITAT